MTNQFHNNNSLLIALKKGNQKAYAFLLENYQHRLCVYAYGLTRDEGLAEDIVQNVFIRTWKKRETLDINYNLTSFLYKSVHNEFVDQYRKKKRLLPLEEKYHKALSSVIEEEESSFVHMINLVKKEIEDLPPKIKETFLLSKVDGLTNQEIADFKGISIKTVESHITKSFSILRKRMEARIKGILFLLFKRR